jgi:predicted nucleic acid-binding protein
MIRILLDTNIILDIAFKRSPYYEDAAAIFQEIDEKTVYGYVSATTITDIFYLLQKEKGKKDAIKYLHKLLLIVDVADVDKDVIINALNSGWSDFEDAVQSQVAIKNNMDAIVTRNTKDYTPMQTVKVCSPRDFIKQLK